MTGRRSHVHVKRALAVRVIIQAINLDLVDVTSLVLHNRNDVPNALLILTGQEICFLPR